MACAPSSLILAKLSAPISKALAVHEKEFIMDSILEFIHSFSPFEQSMIGSTVFLVSTWLIRTLFNKAKKGGSIFLSEYSKIDVVKHTLHKEYINTTDMQLSTFGSTIALLHASRWLIRALLICIFFVGISSFLASNWLVLLASWFCFNCVLEANSWVKNSSSDKSVSHVPEDIKNEIYEKFKPQKNGVQESTANKPIKQD